MIKVYQLISNPYKIPNPFVYALIDGIENLYDDVKWGWGYEKFWSDHVYNYDIVLIQWPEAPLYWDSLSNHTIDEYKQRIADIKSKGIKIISFVHNIVPHYSEDIVKCECYELIYSSADFLLHMGKYSKNMLKYRYPQATHEFIEAHFVYDQIFKETKTREQACSILGLDKKYRYILAFGAFRDDEERELVANLAQDMKSYDKNIMIVAPSYTNLLAPNNCFDIRPRIRKYFMKHRNHIICNGATFNTVSDFLLPYYYAVAEVCLIHRKKILNSGNVPMGFLMKRVVVGPNEGNVGEILTEMGNPTFQVDDRKSVATAVIDSFKLSKYDKGKWNYKYAMENFSTEIFCKKLHDLFVRVMS